jgi:hypothetical protein
LQLLGFQQSQVGGNHGAGLQDYQVAGHQFPGVQGVIAAATQDACVRGRHLPQCRDRVFRAVALYHADSGVQQDDYQDCDGILRFADDRGHHRRGQQYLDHQVPELVQEQQGNPAARGFRQPVRPVLLESVARLGLGQALARVRIQLINGLRSRQRMPLCSLGHVLSPCRR